MIAFSVEACNQATKFLINKTCTTCRIWDPFQTTKDKSVFRKVVGKGAHILFTSLNKSSPDSTPKTSVGRWCLAGAAPTKAPSRHFQGQGPAIPRNLLSCLATFWITPGKSSSSQLPHVPSYNSLTPRPKPLHKDRSDSQHEECVRVWADRHLLQSMSLHLYNST